MSLWVHMSAVITRHSGGAFAAMRFLTAISKLHAVNLITSGSVNGSTSRPVSEVSMFPIIGSILSVIIFFFSPLFRYFVSYCGVYSAILGFTRVLVQGCLDRVAFCFSPFFYMFSFSFAKVGG